MLMVIQAIVDSRHTQREVLQDNNKLIQNKPNSQIIILKNVFIFRLYLSKISAGNPWNNRTTTAGTVTPFRRAVASASGRPITTTVARLAHAGKARRFVAAPGALGSLAALGALDSGVRQ